MTNTNKTATVHNVTISRSRVPASNFFRLTEDEPFLTAGILPDIPGGRPKSFDPEVPAAFFEFFAELLFPRRGRSEILDSFDFLDGNRLLLHWLRHFGLPRGQDVAAPGCCLVTFGRIFRHHFPADGCQISRHVRPLARHVGRFLRLMLDDPLRELPWETGDGPSAEKYSVQPSA